MASASNNRFGGNALLAGGILFTIALVLHPDVSTLERANAASPGMWAFVHWAYLIGDVLLIAGLLMVFRQWPSARLASAPSNYCSPSMGVSRERC